jgi:hypothetical protein
MSRLQRAASAAWAGVLVLAAAVVLAASPVMAQSYILAPCPGGTTPRFEGHEQALWYRRFWTGDCQDLPMFGCAPGRPYWNDVVQTLVARAPADKRAEVASRACRLGVRIGLEWTRPKTERRIDTHDLRMLHAELDKAPDVSAGLAAVETIVKTKLGG